AAPTLHSSPFTSSSVIGSAFAGTLNVGKLDASFLKGLETEWRPRRAKSESIRSTVWFVSRAKLFATASRSSSMEMVILIEAINEKFAIVVKGRRRRDALHK
ncbi:MAG: hypothetical protein SGI88_08675, partial [Candidatus Hydrogenedentes bacterium]|nr:hypothetical protein [Candidatus Hydrogenedentota bacterium]